MAIGRTWKVKPKLELASENITIGPGASNCSSYVALGDLLESSNKRNAKIQLCLDKEQVIAICGKRGSGKSFTLGAVAEIFAVKESISKLGVKPEKKAALLIDPLDIYWSTQFSVSDSENAAVSGNYQLAKQAGLLGLEFAVDVFIPGTKYLDTNDPEWLKPLTFAAHELNENDWEVALAISLTGDMSGQALLETISQVRGGYRNADGKDIDSNDSFSVNDLIAATHSPQIVNTFHQETVRSITQKLSSLNSLGLFSTEPTALNQVLLPGCLSILALSRLPDSLRDLVTSLILRKIFDSRARASFLEKRLFLDTNLKAQEKLEFQARIEQEVPKATILMDEAQIMLHPNMSGPTKSMFTKLVKEGRNLGLSAVVATQQPSAVDKNILSQVETFITHQLVTLADISRLEDNLKSREFEEASYGNTSLKFSQLVRSLQSGESIISASESSLTFNRAFITRIRPRATMHGGVEL